MAGGSCSGLTKEGREEKIAVFSFAVTRVADRRIEWGIGWRGMASPRGCLASKLDSGTSRRAHNLDTMTLGRAARNKEEDVTICGRRLVSSRNKHTSAHRRSRGGIGVEEEEERGVGSQPVNRRVGALEGWFRGRGFGWTKAKVLEMKTGSWRVHVAYIRSICPFERETGYRAGCFLVSVSQIGACGEIRRGRASSSLPRCGSSSSSSSGGGRRRSRHRGRPGRVVWLS